MNKYLINKLAHFLIYNHQEHSHIKGNQLTQKYSLFTDSAQIEECETANGKFYIFGDLISHRECLAHFTPKDLSGLKGNFYLLWVKDQTLFVFNSVFSVLPVYRDFNHSLISSDLNMIKSKITKVSIDKQFILECLLFNYGLFNRTLYNEITLLASNSYLEISIDSTTVNKHTEIKDLFDEVKKQKEISSISSHFIETIGSYFPDVPFHIGFTGGFDGRTILSCATYFKKKIKTFSFGKIENLDVQVPLNNAKALDINYTHYDLGSQEYIQNDYNKSAIEYIQLSNGGNGYLYPHFLYTTKQISKESEHMFGGYFGSELFRALHIQGAVSSSALISIFKDPHADPRAVLYSSKNLKFLNLSEFKNELDQLSKEIIEYTKQIPSDLSRNHKLYLYVFEETLRKIFGQWISVQQNYINVRSPFLDYSFVRLLLKSKYAGANSDFLTKNPYKRLNGQIIYSAIIKQTNPVIYRQKTGNGYRPIDVLSKPLLPNLVLSFARKKMRKKLEKENLDNLGIISGIKAVVKNGIEVRNNHLFKSKLIKTGLKELSSFTPESERDSLLMTLSLATRYEKDNSLN